MIIVNSAGSGANPFAPLQHASWHGFTPTDLVFPTFLFVVGNAMAFTMMKFDPLSNKIVIWKILKRTSIIFLLGFLLYWFPFFKITEAGEWSLSPLSNTRIPGVLQRIGLCYGIAALMIRFLSKKQVINTSILFLFGYWIILNLGGDYTLTGNLVLKVDKWLLGESHLYHGEGIAFDPEGILSTIPSVVNVIIGYQAGMLIRDKGNTFETVAKIMLAGAGMLFIAYAWDHSFPINKKLWTSPFVLHTSGLALMILGGLIYTIEIINWKKGTQFFVVFGKNPLFIYLLSELIVISLWTWKNDNGQPLYEGINEKLYQNIAPGAWGSLAFAISVMIICWAAGWIMDKKKLYIRV
jgi:predicted acyltransferase